MAKDTVIRSLLVQSSNPDHSPMLTVADLQDIANHYAKQYPECKFWVENDKLYGEGPARCFGNFDEKKFEQYSDISMGVKKL